MATLLDVGFLGFFSQIFTVLLVFVFVYALLQTTKILGGEKNIDSLLAIALAFITLLVPGVTKIISLSAPWFVLMFFLIFLIAMMSMFMGANVDSLKSALVHEGLVYWVIVIGILIVFGAASQVYGKEILSATSANATTASGQVLTNVGATIFHPKVLGMALILMIASLAINKLAAYTK